MHRDEHVRHCSATQRARRRVLDQLEMAADLCAAVFGAVEGHAWDRRFVYNSPTAAELPAWLGRHTVDEGEHHLMDVASCSPPWPVDQGASAHS